MAALAGKSCFTYFEKRKRVVTSFYPTAGLSQSTSEYKQLTASPTTIQYFELCRYV